LKLHPVCSRVKLVPTNVGRQCSLNFHVPEKAGQLAASLVVSGLELSLLEQADKRSIAAIEAR